MTALINPVAAGDSTPSIKFPDVGSSVTVGLVAFDEYQQRDFDNEEPKTWPDGKPMMGTRITGVVHEVSGVEVGRKDDRRAPDVGEIVAIFVEGGRFYAWRDASKAAAANGHQYEVGDLVWFGCTGTEPAKNSRHNDRKVYEAKIGKPGTEHTDLMAQCKKAHAEHTAIAVTPPAADAPAAVSAPF